LNNPIFWLVLLGIAAFLFLWGFSGHLMYHSVLKQSLAMKEEIEWLRTQETLAVTQKEKALYFLQHELLLYEKENQLKYRYALEYEEDAEVFRSRYYWRFILLGPTS